MRFCLLMCIVFLGSSLMVHGQADIRLNQIGFYPHGPKYAVVMAGTALPFRIVEEGSGDTVHEGELGDSQLWSHSGETVRIADFSDFDIPGIYRIEIDGAEPSHAFRIDAHVHDALVHAALKGYYFQRASTELMPEHAGAWARPLGHPDNTVLVHSSAATAQRPTGTVISSPKGWYDAGDYNKYIVNSGISTYQILAAYEHFPEYFLELELDIPESGDEMPDILDEALWNLEWMLTMQDPEDGGVYHKLTTANFSGAVMPHQATATRYVVQKSTPATLDFAAVMAVAARIFADFEEQKPGFAAQCLQAAQDAWAWALDNPNMRFSQSTMNANYSPDINTGEYGDGTFIDEFRWASAELTISTKESIYADEIDPTSANFGVPWWGSVESLGLYSLVFHRGALGDLIDTSIVKNRLLSPANWLRGGVATSAYHTVMGISNGDFVWGSNGGAGNQSMLLVQAYLLTRDITYLDAALQNLDYLLGRNAVDYCFLTGSGSNPTLHPHHRQSQADGVADPVPGLLAGGPNPGMQDGCNGYIGSERARAYLDDWCSYASNEITINWNSPLVYVAGAMEALAQEHYTTSAGYVTRSEFKPDLITLAPNPTSGRVQMTLRLPVAGTVDVQVYDTSGSVVATPVAETAFTLGDSGVVWDTPDTAGLYHVSVRVKGKKGGLFYGATTLIVRGRDH